MSETLTNRITLVTGGGRALAPAGRSEVVS